MSPAPAITMLGSGPPIVTVHGAPGTDHTAFRPYLDALADEFRIVYFDLPGHGASAPLEDPSLAAVAASVGTVLDALGAPRATLLGSSYGGFLALTYAIAHPERVERLILVDTAPSANFRGESLAAARERATPAMLAALDRLWDDSLRDDAEFGAAWRALLPLYFHSAAPAAVRAIADRHTYRLETRRAILPTVAAYDVRAALPGLRVPALIAVGRHDWITGLAQTRELAAALPGARLAIFEESGHYPFVDENERFLQTVREFMKGTPHDDLR